MYSVTEYPVGVKQRIISWHFITDTCFKTMKILKECISIKCVVMDGSDVNGFNTTKFPLPVEGLSLGSTIRN